MEIRCERKTGYLFSPKLVREGNETTTTFNGISLGKTYKVYGMILYQEGIYYLVYDDFLMPNWYYSVLFKTVASDIPQGWYYKYFGQNESLSAIWGYDELVNDLKHYDGLSEQDQEEIEVFLKRKKEMDN